MTDTIVWSRDGCKYCDLAKDALRDHNITFEERNISKDKWTKEDILNCVPGAKTVPQIFLRGVYVGGYSELEEILGVDRGTESLILDL